MIERNGILYAAAASVVAIVANTALYARNLTHAHLIASELERIGAEEREEDEEWLRCAHIGLERWYTLSPFVRTYVGPTQPEWNKRPSVCSRHERRFN